MPLYTCAYHHLTCTVDEGMADGLLHGAVHTRPGAPVNTRATMVVESGRAGLKKE